MIIGRGMLAKSMERIDNDYAKYIFFCSGVSNSKEVDGSEYKREKELLMKYLSRDKCLIYFSSYFVGFDKYLEEKYYKHKQEMELLVSSNFKYYKIFRLAQVVGNSKNNFTLTNFLYNSILNGSQINIYENVKRNLIDIDDIVSVLEYINKHNLFLNKTTNLISTKSFEIEKIVETFELVLNRKAIKNVQENKEKDFNIIISEEILNLYGLLGIKFDEVYLEKLIKKYYKRSNLDNCSHTKL